MNIHRPVRSKKLTGDAQANIARVQEIWTDCRAQYGGQGLFLFGAFTGADAMFAPVVHRFRTYDIAVTPVVRDYMNTMWENPAFRQWTEAALAETLIIEKFEMD
jgi:glutathione S-transferase